MSFDPTQTTLDELRQMIAEKRVSAQEAVGAYLGRIEAHEGAIGAYEEVWSDSALKRAAAVDAGEVTGSLAGVPIAVKALFCTEEGTSTASSNMLAGYRSPFTATAIARLEAAGAIVIGKTRMDEFAMGSSGETSRLGVTKNPWDVERVPGGSSSGSAAAIAGDLCAGAIGTDTGGSIRQPAALCNVVGLKPTYGRISRWGMIAFASSLDQAGPLTHTVKDAALLLAAMSGGDPMDGTCANEPVPGDLTDVDGDPGKLRIGLPSQYFGSGNTEDVQKAVEAAKAIYREAGAELVEIDLPHTDYGIPVYYIVATAEASSNLARYDGIHYGHRSQTTDDLVELYAASRSEGFGDEVKRRIMLGTYALSSGYYDAYYNRALKVRRLIRRDFDVAFESCDAILCPTTPGPAFKIGAKTDDPLAMYLNDIYTVNAPLAGLPALSVPAGMDTSEGRELPIGLQLIGRPFDEARLLRYARVYERGTDYHRQRPAMV
ncbi:Asp-tRNA(Asn)/Glu-tRNA(Gln) amidotransferase subunit GatA [Mucisphaera sp.]|uniref:Asp-tRNA(Asn)/Glu-tRNA(Gln) amidotransferase subunit GatA n=1 Tax=Mucisphaera sp. TaxID=2913024 RepID=UPI003D0B58AC